MHEELFTDKTLERLSRKPPFESLATHCINLRMQLAAVKEARATEVADLQERIAELEGAASEVCANVEPTVDDDAGEDDDPSTWPGTDPRHQRDEHESTDLYVE